MLYYTHIDHLGSIIALTDASCTIVENYSYDAWGSRRNPDDYNLPDDRTNILIDRGYTGHEHLDKINLINMNGRVYDPLVGRMLSPDILVQNPSFTQSFNRYSYCWNNPLRYTDPSGYNVKPDMSKIEKNNSASGLGYWPMNWYMNGRFDFDNPWGDYFGSYISDYRNSWEEWALDPISNDINFNDYKELKNSGVELHFYDQVKESEGSEQGGFSGNFGKIYTYMEGVGWSWVYDDVPKNAQPSGGTSADNILGKLYWHMQFGGKKPFELDASSMDFSGTNQTELKINGKQSGPINLFNAAINSNSLAFGVLNATRVGSSDFFTIENNEFDFDYQSGKSFARNFFTYQGGGAFGQFFNTPITPWSILRNNSGIGGSFPVIFKGTIYIPKK